ncbi:MAG: NTE family protein [Halioglobus sp.]|jgi:NTE family protein
MRKIVSDVSIAATKQVVRGTLDFIQRYASVGPKLGTAMNAANG